MTLKAVVPLTDVKKYPGTQRFTGTGIEIADEEVEISVDGVKYLLIPSPKVLIPQRRSLPYLLF